MRSRVVPRALIVVSVLSPAIATSQGQPQEPKFVELREIGYTAPVTADGGKSNTGRTIRDTCYLLSGGGVNAVALIAGDQVVLVDTNAAGWGQPMLEAIERVSEKPVRTIINTNAYGDHTGGNSEFPTVIEIVAHEKTKANMARMPAFSGANAKFLPNKTFQDRMSLLDGVQRVELYYFGAGHTSGDAIVVFPALHTAILGDLFPGKHAPVIDTSNGGSGVAYPETLAKAVAGIKGVDRVIPGHGTPTSPGSPMGKWITWDDLREYADFNRKFLEVVQDAMRAGKSVDEAVASLKLPDKYKDYGMENAKANVQAIYDELRK